MNWRFDAVGCALLLTALCGGAAHAQQWPSVGAPLPQSGTGAGDAAVVVGIDDYLVLPDVPGAADNARDWHAWLVNARGVPVERAVLLTDHEATREKVERALKQAAASTRAGGRLFFVFIGHGAPAPGADDGLLLGSDTQPDADSLSARGISQQHIADLVGAGKQADTVLIYDACFSGKTQDGAAALVPGLQATLPVRKQAAQPGRLTIFSSSETFAGPLPGHGRPAFSYVLLGALRGWADADGDHAVSASEAWTYARGTLSTALKGSDRLPTLRGDASIVVAKNVTESGPDVQAILSGRCPDRTRWDGRHCREVACPAGTAFDGTTCRASATGVTCPTATSWNGSSCIATSVTCPPGATWDGAQCRVTVAAAVLPAPPRGEKPMPPGLDAAALDLSVSPCDDFYQHACGGWLDTTIVPSDRGRWSRGFSSAADRNALVLKTILEDAERGALPADTFAGKELGDFWNTCLADPAPGLAQARISALRSISRPALVDTIAALHAEGVDSAFELSVWPGTDGERRFVGFVGPPSLWLDQKRNPQGAAFDAYGTLIERVFIAAGDSPRVAAQMRTRVLEIEASLARSTPDRAELADPGAGTSTTAESLAATTGFPWKQYLARRGIAGRAPLRVMSPDQMAAIGQLLATAPIESWRAYLAWTFLQARMVALPDDAHSALADFKTALHGRPATVAPRWRRCVDNADQALGDALGRAFVARAFAGDSKSRADRIATEIVGAFSARFDGVAWMDEATRTKARRKLEQLTWNIGHPQSWDDTRPVTGRTSHLENLGRAGEVQARRALDQLGRVVDSNAWSMSIPTVNGYYDPASNQLVFPAGILQPPIFNKNAVEAANFGAFGMIFAHELTHGFDESGASWDGRGGPSRWWSDGAAAGFSHRAQCLERHYDAFTVLDGAHVDGKLTRGENIADLGGIAIAHAAFQRWLKRNPGAGAGLRYTPEQQFFLGFAQSWCTKARDDDERARLKSAPHAPPKWRVNGVLQNLPAFQAAFSCKSTSHMVRSPESRCTVW